MTWSELIRRLKKAGFVESREGRGSHVALVNPASGKIVWVARHTKKEVGTGLARKILKDAGVEP